MEFIDVVDKHVQEIFARCTHKNDVMLGDRTSLPDFYPNNTYFDPKIVIRRWEEEGR